MKTDLLQSCGHCSFFQTCWHIKCSTVTVPSFRIWNRSAGILSPPLALLVVMLQKAHVMSHSKMSNSRWVITPSWLSGSLNLFVQFFCVFLPPLCNIFCFCSVHTISVLYCAHLCMKCSLGMSNFLEISSLSHSVIFLYVFALFLRKAFFSLLAILGNSAFRWVYRSSSPLPFTSLLFTAICKTFSELFIQLHSVLQGQICLWLQVSLDFLFLHSNPL